MIAHAPTLEDRIPGAQFLGLITGKENTYFERSFAALHVSAEDRSVDPVQVTVEFQKLMRAAAASGSLARMLAVLIAAEWSWHGQHAWSQPGRKVFLSGAESGSTCTAATASLVSFPTSADFWTEPRPHFRSWSSYRRQERCVNGRWRGEGGKADAGGKGQEAVVGTGKVAGGGEEERGPPLVSF